MSTKYWNTPTLRLELARPRALCGVLAALAAALISLFAWRAATAWQAAYGFALPFIIAALCMGARECLRLNCRWGRRRAIALLCEQGEWRLQWREGDKTGYAEMIPEDAPLLREFIVAARFRPADEGPVFRLALSRADTDAETWRRLRALLGSLPEARV